MDRESFILPGILILVLIIVLVLVVAFSGNNTFTSDKISFQYPAGWSQSSIVGNFSNTTLYSQVTFTANIMDSNGNTQPAYIIVQVQQRAQGVINLPSTSTIVTNTSNSSVSSVNVDNITATQLGGTGGNISEKVTIIEKNNYYMVITFISPPFALNQTSEAYNMILKTLNIS
ncbi:MAG: hypothetical protein LLF83_02305 [Methanobacterium sp.]|nr:hypothetical protein [Methanobacterium sp.]